MFSGIVEEAARVVAIERDGGNVHLSLTCSFVNELKIDQSQLLVVVDDIALPFGELRMRKKGSAGGHNGLKNITELLGGEDYARMRFGIGGDFARGHQVDYVLGEWSQEEREKMDERLKVFSDAILSYISVGLDRTMNAFNKK